MASKRPFDFYNGTADKARFRQRNLCAHCGCVLIDELEFAHHVVPNQCGNPADPNHQWLKTLINCVLLYHECHQRVHQDGRTRNGSVAPATYLPYSHETAKDHRAWAKQIDKMSAFIWEYLREKSSK
jgi:hypothetical protein